MKIKRKFIGGFSVLVLTLAHVAIAAVLFQRSERTPLSSEDSEFRPNVEIHLTARRKKVSILKGKLTEVLSYEGELLKGDSANFIENPSTYLGPTIRVKKWQKIRIYFKNEIPEKSIIHWHGLHVAEDMDGHPRYAISNGETYVYEFEVKNRAGTYLYHPHPHGITGKQVYYGLAGLFIVEDEEEIRLNLPSGEFDIPIVIQDRRFNPDGSLSYVSAGMRGNMEMVNGFLGDVILVNGELDYRLAVKTAPYRFRLVNVSNSRIYRLYSSDKSEFVVIASDGGLLEAPMNRDYIVLGPGERVEIIMNFSEYDVGEVIELRSMPFEGGSIGMMGRRMMGRGMRGPVGMVNGGEDLKIAEFQVVTKTIGSKEIPGKLSNIKGPNLNDAVNKDNPRRFYFEMRPMMRLTINGRTFEMDKVTSDEVVKLNTTEVWEIINSGHMSMPHPVHIHGLQFRIIDREGIWPDFKNGYIDSGLKDTVLLMPGERVRILLKFEDFTGTYVYHCHNLEHADLGMMRNYKIVK